MPTEILLMAACLLNVVSGFNDGGNLVASFVGARAFTLLGAALVLLTGIAAGPWLVGTRVAHTIVFAVVNLPQLGPQVFLAAMAGALLALVVAWWRRVPTSTSLALVGALAGAGLASGGPDAVHWAGVWGVLGGMVAALAAGALGGVGMRLAARSLLSHAGEGIDRVLRLLQVGSGLLQGVAYGGNDAEKAVGLLALVGAWQIGNSRWLAVNQVLPVPLWAVWLAVISFGLGMLLGGLRVAHTLGFGLYPVRTTDALSAQLAAGLAVIAAGAVGRPVSSTQTTTAALLAAGASRRLSLPRWSLVAQMVQAWAITLPLSFLCGGLVAACLHRII